MGGTALGWTTLPRHGLYRTPLRAFHLTAASSQSCRPSQQHPFPVLVWHPPQKIRVLGLDFSPVTTRYCSHHSPAASAGTTCLASAVLDGSWWPNRPTFVELLRKSNEPTRASILEGCGASCQHMPPFRSASLRYLP
ncbi:hypothetical protein CMUS01_08624 [Colletotrichum musicola]|uniref:Uncharacterized protein n=1 Tax=Colletotrichum musicola TaxID=2175873 RepID=A0A8H6NCK3_9PEZI|nr:hypothetical protein CMUS01_08624 [Colletotrichum musicola]